MFSRLVFEIKRILFIQAEFWQAYYIFSMYRYRRHCQKSSQTTKGGSFAGPCTDALKFEAEEYCSDNSLKFLRLVRFSRLAGIGMTSPSGIPNNPGNLAGSKLYSTKEFVRRNPVVFRRANRSFMDPRASASLSTECSTRHNRALYTHTYTYTHAVYCEFVPV